MRREISLFIPDREEVAVYPEEALRYMGVRSGQADENVWREVEAVRDLVRDVVQYLACYITVPVEVKPDGTCLLGDMTVLSRSLARNLTGCRQAFLFAATAGVGVDRLIARLSVASAARGLMADALGSAAIEDFCDLLNGKLSEGRITRPRFSPGYGDMNLSHQADMISMLDTAKHIGLTLTDSLMLTPTKSVTAVIGLQGMEEKNTICI